MPSPTAPAPGPSLLDDTEAKYLENFFDGVSSNDPYNFDNMFGAGTAGPEMAMGWDDIPPAFMGTASSYGQQPQQSQPSLIGNHGIPGQLYDNMIPQMNHGPMVPSTASADVLEAATLLQNGAAGRSHSMGGVSMYPSMAAPPTNGVPRSHSISQYPQQQQQTSHGFPQRAAGEEFYNHGYYKDMVFGGDPEEGMRRRQGIRNHIEIQWGSDTRFNNPQGYTSSDHQRRIAEAEQTKLSALDRAFTLDMSNVDSAENTQPSSPAHARMKQGPTDGEDDDSRARKRRKSKHQEEDEEDEEEEEEEDDYKATTSSKAAGKKRRPGKKTNAEPASGDGGDFNHKRRKSTAVSASASKAPRENLTEDQKRENHIKSEQKRRSLIKEGFDDLHELVPGLRGGGFSKSAILIMTADWLETLIKGNEELRRRIDDMGGR